MSEELVKRDERNEAMVWEHLGAKSVTQISEATGIPRDEVFVIKRRLFDEIDALTLQEHRAKIMSSLHALVSDALAKSKSYSDERNYAPMLSAATGAMKVLLAELTRIEKQSTGEVDALNRRRMDELVRLMQYVVDTSVDELADAPDRLDKTEMLAVFNRRLIEGATKIDQGAEDEQDG